MKRLGYLMVGYWLTSQFVCAQDVIYLADQTQVSGTLADLTAEKVTLRVPKGEAMIKFSYGLDRVTAVVNQRGRFLCMQYLVELPGDERDRLIQQFLTSPNQLSSDVIIRRNLSEAIYGKVAYSQGDVVNYTTLDGLTASLPKTDVIAIFYGTGKHELLADALTLCDKPVMLRNEPMPATPVPLPAADKISALSPKSTAGADPKKSLELSAEEYDDYRRQGLERVKDFSLLLSLIADKLTDAEAKNKAVKQVLTLFKPGATIQVSSLVRGGEPNTYTMPDYLKRLKLLPYSSVSLQWVNIQYVDELTQKDDGSYHGKIRGEQQFSGLGTGGEVQYGDITQKDVDVLVTPYTKRISGYDKRRWEILLGDIGVVATQ